MVQHLEFLRHVSTHLALLGDFVRPAQRRQLQRDRDAAKRREAEPDSPGKEASPKAEAKAGWNFLWLMVCSLVGRDCRMWKTGTGPLN